MCSAPTRSQLPLRDVVDRVFGQDSRLLLRQNETRQRFITEQEKNLPSTVQLCPSSFYRKIRTELGEIPVGMHRELGLCFSDESVLSPEEEKQFRSDIKGLRDSLVVPAAPTDPVVPNEVPPEDPPLVRALNSLMTKRKKVEPAVLRLVLEKLERDGLCYTLGLTKGAFHLSTFPTPEKGLLAVPAVLLRPPERHIVAFLVDIDNRTLEYYDPEGLAIKDNAEKILHPGPPSELKVDKTLLCMFYELREKYNCTKVKENVRKHQWDERTNALLISKFFMQRVQGLSFDSISQMGCSFEELDGPVRRELIKLLRQEVSVPK